MSVSCIIEVVGINQIINNQAQNGQGDMKMRLSDKWLDKLSSEIYARDGNVFWTEADYDGFEEADQFELKLKNWGIPYHREDHGDIIEVTVGFAGVSSPWLNYYR